ncbi:uncharacterized protein LOC125513419 [Triticum urartu]|nr:uncharacterized protein LOC125513419 [Triticum urartu]
MSLGRLRFTFPVSNTYRRRSLLSVSDAAAPMKITTPLLLRSLEKGNSSRARRHASSEPHGGRHIGAFMVGPGRCLVSVVDGLGSALASKRGEVGRPACVGRKGHEQEGDALEGMEEEVGGGISVHGDAAKGPPCTPQRPWQRRHGNPPAHLGMPRLCHMVAEMRPPMLCRCRLILFIKRRHLCRTTPPHLPHCNGHLLDEAEVSIMTMSRPVADVESSFNGK